MSEGQHIPDESLSTIYLPWRCYGPSPGHPAWLFQADSVWYAGNLEWEEYWRPERRTFEVLDDALAWLRVGVGKGEPSPASESRFCAIDSWKVTQSFPAAGVAAHEAAGTMHAFNWETNNCWHETLRVFGALLNGPGSDPAQLGLPDERRHPWPKPPRCRSVCGHPG